MKKGLISLLMLFMSVTLMFGADGFTNVPTNSKYFYGKTYPISYSDEAPTYVGNQYFFAVNLNSTSYTRVSDTASWTLENLNLYGRKADYTIKSVSDDVKIGLFSNPSPGGWGLQTSNSVTFTYASDLWFSDMPNMIKNQGKFPIKIIGKKSELPGNVILQYTKNGVWKTLATLPTADTMLYTIDDTDGKFYWGARLDTVTVYFRVLYDTNTAHVLGTASTLYKNETPGFNFLNQGGSVPLYTKIVISWEKTSEYDNVYLTAKVNGTDEPIGNGIFNGNGNIEYYLSKVGTYEFKATVKDANGYYPIERSLVYYVGDPCDSVKQDNAKLKKEIVTKDSIIEVLTKTVGDKEKVIVEKEKLIVEYKTLLDSLEGAIKDTLITVIIDTKDTILTSIDYNTFDSYDNKAIEGPAKIYIFDLTGKLIDKYFIARESKLDLEKYNYSILLVFAIKEEGNVLVIDKFKYIK